MKPRIRMVAGRYALEYNFQPRSFWLFGLSEQEREAVRRDCVHRSEFDQLTEAVACLYKAYRAGDVNRWREAL